MSLDIVVRHSFAKGSAGAATVGLLENAIGSLGEFAPAISDVDIAKYDHLSAILDDDDDVDPEEVFEFVEALRANAGRAGFALSDGYDDLLPTWGILLVPRLEFMFSENGILQHARCDYQIVGGFGAFPEGDSESAETVAAIAMFATGVTPLVGLWMDLVGEDGSGGPMVLEHHIVSKAGLDPSLAGAVRREVERIISEGKSLGTQSGPFITIDEIYFAGSPANQAEELREKALLHQITLPTKWLSPIEWKSSPYGYIDEGNECRSWLVEDDAHLGELRPISGWRHGDPASLMSIEDGSYHIAIEGVPDPETGDTRVALYAHRLSIEFETHEAFDAVNLVIDCDQVWGDFEDDNFNAHLAEETYLFAERLTRNAFLRPTGVPRRLRFDIQGPACLIEALTPFMDVLKAQIREFAILCPGDNALEEVKFSVIEPKVVKDDGMAFLAIEPLTKVVTLPDDLEDKLDDLGEVEGEHWFALDLDPKSEAYAKGLWVPAGEIAGKPTRLPFILFRSGDTKTFVTYSTLSMKQAPGVPTSTGRAMTGDIGSAILLAMSELDTGVVWKGRTPGRTRSKKSAPFVDLVTRVFPEDRFSIVPFDQAYFRRALSPAPVNQEIVVDVKMRPSERRHVSGCSDHKHPRGTHSRILTIPDVAWTPMRLEIALGEILASYAIDKVEEKQAGPEDEALLRGFLSLVRGASYALACHLNGGAGTASILAASSRLLAEGGSPSLANAVLKDIKSKDLGSIRSIDDSIGVIKDILDRAMVTEMDSD